MSSVLCVFVSLLSATPAADAGVIAPSSTPERRTFMSGGVEVRWTTERLVATWDGGTPFVDELTVDRTCVSNGFDSRAFSLVGPMLSWLRINSVDCGGAHPSCSATVRTVDLRSGKDVTLQSLFGSAEVMRALRRDPFVLSVTNPDGGVPPKTFEALRDALLLNRNVILSPSAFAVHHLEPGGVAVRVILVEGAHAVCGDVVELGLVLPTPATLAGALQRAASGEEGFLAAKRPGQARWRKTVEGIEPAPPPRRAR